MRKLFLIVVILGVVACGPRMSTQLEHARAENRQKLSGLSLGMEKEMVLETMGTETFYLKQDEMYVGIDEIVITNPYRSSATMVDTNQIEILYYYTDQKSADGAITDDELTPIILVNGMVTGWGWDYWNDTAAKYEIRLR